MTKHVILPGVVVLLLAVGSLRLSTAQTPENPAEFIKVKPAEVRWTGAAGGMQTANLEGNPSRPGHYVMRVKFPPGTMTRPHTHSQDRYVTVISGTWHAGTGSEFDINKTDPMPPGSFMKHPARTAHFDGAKDEEVIVQIMGMGPVTTDYLERR